MDETISKKVKRAASKCVGEDKWTAKVEVPDGAKICILKKDNRRRIFTPKYKNPYTTLDLKPEDYGNDSEILVCLKSLGVRCYYDTFCEDPLVYGVEMRGWPFIYSKDGDCDGYDYDYKKTGRREFTFTVIPE